MCIGNYINCYRLQSTVRFHVSSNFLLNESFVKCTVTNCESFLSAYSPFSKQVFRTSKPEAYKIRHLLIIIHVNKYGK